jgi:hypothetical protein
MSNPVMVAFDEEELLIAPIVHRILHRFQMDGSDKEETQVRRNQ